MTSVIIAIVCNLTMVLILASGIMSAIRDGVKTSIVKLVLTLSGGVGAFFLTPVIHDTIYGVDGVPTIFENVGISTGSVNSILFLVFFLIFYAFTILICNIVRHFQIKKLRDKKLNNIKMKRAKSINPRAEKAVKRAEWKALKAKRKERIRWYHRLISSCIGAIIAVTVGYVVSMPYGYIAKDICAKEESKVFLLDGFNYTLNGLVGDEVPDFLIHSEKETEVPSNEDNDEENLKTDTSIEE